MLRDGLAGRPEAVAHREETADLEQRLTVARGEFIQNQTSGLVVKSPEDVRHIRDNTQVTAYLSSPLSV